MSVLSVQGLNKKYPAFELKGVSFTVEEGRVVGLIGRNGAGKSTTMKGILNFIPVDGGAVEIFGMNMREHEREIKEKIGYVAGGFSYYPQKKLRAIAKVCSQFYAGWQEDTYRRALSLFALDENKKVCELSEGMKVKFFIALALSHGARLLILDEPTSGLDPVSREEFCDVILTTVKNEGVSVLFSTHITSDLMRIADDVVYISRGEVLTQGTLQQILNAYKLAFFSAPPAEPEKVVGLKEVKNGYEGLIPSGVSIACDRREPATLDALMVHLEQSV